MKKKSLLITGGTGGHVIPAQNFANYLSERQIDCRIIVDKRGFKYIKNFNGKIHIIRASNLNGKIISKIFGLISLFIGFIQSFYLIVIYKPRIVISFGSYASFFPMLSCLILKRFYGTKLFIHEQNSIIGRTNSFFLGYVDKILLNFDVQKSINNKYKHKFYVVGSPQKNNIILNVKKSKNFKKKFVIFIYGGSQGSEFVSNFASKLIKLINKEKLVEVKFIFQCSKKIINHIKNDLKNIDSDIIIKEYFNNIDEILSQTSVAISRAGAGSIIDLMTYRIPSVLLPLPSAKDNHQFYNASILQKHDLAIILDQNKNEFDKAKNYIYGIYNDHNKVKLINDRFDKISIKNSNSLIYKLIVNEK